MHKKLLSILALVILATSTLVGCSGAPSNSSTLTILSITEGDVFVMKAGTDDWTEATVEMSLEVGDTIKTGDDSGAEITFFDGSTIELEAGTQIEITSLDSSPDTGAKTITLMQTIGTTISRVTKLVDPASSYAIETPSGVAAVRGSTMIVQIIFNDPNNEDVTVLVTSVEGQVYFIGHGVELPVPEGGQVVASNQTVEVILANELSLAVDDSAVTDEDTSVTVAAPGVLDNDSGLVPGDTLAVTAVDTSGTGGTLTAWGSDGSFTYDPNGQFEYLQAGNSTTDSFTYLVSDGHGGIDTATVTITINGVNDAPTDISLDNGSVAENQSPGTTVGSFSTTDPDAGDTSAYSLVSGEGGNNNSWFMIVGSQLRAAASFDYETKNSYSIRVRTTDLGGLHYEEVFIITVADVYEPPVNNPPVNSPPVVVPDAAVTDEDNPVTVGAPGVLDNDSDPDVSDTLAVASVDTSGTAGAVTAWGANGSFTYDPNAQFEHLQAGSSSIDHFFYTVSDGHGGTGTAAVTITITGVNDAPTDISLDNGSVAENQPPGTAVGSFSTTDPDTGDTFTYSLVDGEGGDDNVWFTTAGNQLQTTASFDYETNNSYSIRVRTTDSGALHYEEAFTITITNVNEPPVAENDTATTSQDTAVTIDVLNNDSDPDHDTLTVDSVTQGAHGSVINNGGDVTYTPDDDFNGTDSFNYTISDGNGGTDTATVSVDIPEPTVETVRFPDEGTAYIGYEDTRHGDFDYNDFGMNMYIQETYVDNCLTEINMWFKSARKQSGGSHDIHIRRTLSGSTTYNYTIERNTTAQGTETPEATNASSQGNFDIVLFDTEHYTAGDTVTIHIEITDGCEPYSSTPIWAHYDPYMYYRNHAYHHIGDMQSAVAPLPPWPNGYDVPYILVIPLSGWGAPAEGQCITDSWPCFDNYYATGSPEEWYEAESCD
jgi:VCBS repeat-containing protein